MPFTKGHKGFLTREHYQKIGEKLRGRKRIMSESWYINIRKANEKKRGQIMKRESIQKRLDTLKERGIICKPPINRMYGEANPNWHGGVTLANKLARQRPEYISWRKSVYERDNYTCQICTKKGGKLHPHHIKSFSKFIKLRYEVSNGLTLCISCHAQLHREIGYK